MTSLLRRFWQDTRAAVAFEAVIIMPILAWGFLSSFIFFDAFRVYNSSIKATYAVADVLSRQTNTVTEDDIEGLLTVFKHLVRDSGASRMRVTQIMWNGTRYCVDWSYATDGESRLFHSSMAEIEDALPVMAVSERIVLVETFVPYDPAFDTGLTLLNFNNFTFTRPRYAGQVPFETPYNAACN
ncbi:MAG: hypothetical protein NXH79_06135 [Rhodobacteraceae bacterium]|nr:hypothetical protein [Paracoccaceae bacterium]